MLEQQTVEYCRYGLVHRLVLRRTVTAEGFWSFRFLRPIGRRSCRSNHATEKTRAKACLYTFLLFLEAAYLTVARRNGL